MTDEDKFIPLLWALNDEYPEYIHCVYFDHRSPPYHLIDEVKKIFKKNFLDAIDAAMEKINEDIEVYMETGVDIKAPLEKRKELRALKDIDLSACNTIDELHALIPETLKPYWRKQ